jgi:ElaB/YqjD/DUF883 family membrane-anchored ribosome-binding protein
MEMGDKTLESLSDKLDELDDLVGQYPELGELQQKADELRERAEAMVREHPLLAVGLAVMVGYLIGRLFAGDDD